MKKSDRFKSLMEAGYFPEELPPPFHTSDLAKYRESVSKAWSSVPGQYPKTTHEIYSNPRIKRVRRNLAIVNPIAQLHLSQLVADHWVDIRKHLKTSDYSIEIPEIESGRSRAVTPPDFALVALRRTEISAAFDHALVSDISRFYGTLYTHAIPWALHGKRWCKKNLNNKPLFEASLGARLDKAVCKGQDNQTIGIPVGPDTSRIISEIVGVAIDHHVQKTLKLDPTRAFRHVDDWYIGFDNAGEAEDAVATLATRCRDYELELNAEKTRTLHASSSVDSLWPTELREYRFRGNASGQVRSLEHYFTKAFQFANENPDQNVLDYAVKRTKTVRILRNNWRSYETFLLKAARSNSTVIPAVVEILVSYNHNGYALGRDRIAKLIEDLVRKNAPLAHHAEVAWALFLAKALRLRISKGASKAVSGLESSVCGLLALDLDQNGLFDGALDASLWRQSMTPQGLRSHMWLLAYEADLKGWLKGSPTDFVDNDSYFNALKSKGISFYDVKRNVTHIRKQKPKRHSAAFLEFLQILSIHEPGSWEVSDVLMSPY